MTIFSINRILTLQLVYSAIKQERYRIAVELKQHRAEYFYNKNRYKIQVDEAEKIVDAIFDLYDGDENSYVDKVKETNWQLYQLMIEQSKLITSSSRHSINFHKTWFDYRQHIVRKLRSKGLSIPDLVHRQPWIDDNPYKIQGFSIVRDLNTIKCSTRKLSKLYDIKSLLENFRFVTIPISNNLKDELLVVLGINSQLANYEIELEQRDSHE